MVIDPFRGLPCTSVKPAARSTRYDRRRNAMAPTMTPQRPEDLVQAEELLQHFEALEAQFQQVRDGLMHCHRLTTLGTIASTIAHEYNNILTPVLSYAQLALSRPDDATLMRKA